MPLSRQTRQISAGDFNHRAGNSYKDCEREELAEPPQGRGGWGALPYVAFSGDVPRDGVLSSSGAHHPEHPTPMCSCNGVFTSWAIFRSISLSREN